MQSTLKNTYHCLLSSILCAVCIHYLIEWMYTPDLGILHFRCGDTVVMASSDSLWSRNICSHYAWFFVSHMLTEPGSQKCETFYEMNLLLNVLKYQKQKKEKKKKNSKVGGTWYVVLYIDKSVLETVKTGGGGSYSSPTQTGVYCTPYIIDFFFLIKEGYSHCSLIPHGSTGSSINFDVKEKPIFFSAKFQLQIPNTSKLQWKMFQLLVYRV